MARPGVYHGGAAKTRGQGNGAVTAGLPRRVVGDPSQRGLTAAPVDGGGSGATIGAFGQQTELCYWRWLAG